MARMAQPEVSPEIAALRKEARDAISTQRKRPPKSLPIVLGTKDGGPCDCGKVATCEHCHGTGTRKVKIMGEIRKPSAAAWDRIERAADTKTVIEELPEKDETGNRLRRFYVKRNNGAFNAYATHECLFLADTTVRIYGTQADLDALLAEPLDAFPQSEVGPLLQHLMTLIDEENKDAAGNPSNP